MPASARVLLVGAPEPSGALRAALTEAAFEVQAEVEPLRACTLLRSQAFDAVVARLPQPGTDALALVRAARRHSPPAVTVFHFDEAGPDGAVLETVSRAPETAVVTSAEPAATIGAVQSLLRGEPVVSAPADAEGGTEPLDGLLTSIEAAGTARSTADLEAVRARLPEAALGASGSRAAWLVTWDPEGGRVLRTRDAAAPPGLAAEVRLARRPLVRHGRGESASFLGVPVEADDAVTAALLIEFESGVDASGGLPFAEALTRLAELSEVTVRLRERVERSPNALTTTLWTALALRGLDVEGHARRVAETAVSLGRAMGFAPSDGALLDVRWAALLHDVGKLGLPDDVLAGETLTEAQRAARRQHPLLAERVLSGWPQLEGAARLVRSSHERWDGSGFPDGLSGDAIPLGSRVLAVADAWDTFAAGADARNERGGADLLEAVRRHAGARFDPEIVEALEYLTSSRVIPRVVGPSDEGLAVA
ncbi:MAG: HD domain-containing phosphohydrolase [Dehalococcoidia bacterium]